MKLDKYSLALIELTQHVGTEHFYSKLKDFFKITFDFDELIVLQFHKSADTKLHYRYGNDGKKNMLYGEESWRYLTRLYVLDPFYRVFADKGKEGFFSLDEIAPDEFSNSYSSYFNFLSLTDEVGYLFPIDKDNCLHLDISRFGNSEKFSSLDKTLFAQLVTPIQNLCNSHLAMMGESSETTHSNVENVLLNFGKDILTKKEYQVCQLLLQGHSTKAIGTIMTIGYETVKMHKKNIYSKTFLSSQSELLALFIDILQSESLDKDVDHLSIYVDGQ
ncbi:helix-turn-helix transcriptional regulator [Colwellia psychrerythraea]|uniref:Transcriptional regulator, LuxR family n=1 Tax=Colwellia psychrerythraea (strain 34H / ATCC BAA-681) TaxID=167879 RepID=Q489W7_COLP3|nr:helix-turn-helix transcriptional regulator [Colwellia psychrerythraea]AAZ25567.1 transcriptional regulator, LuxR family [Colwellia psychrerythraea 34H]